MNNIKDASVLVNSTWSHFCLDGEKVEMIKGVNVTLTKTNKTYGSGYFIIHRVNQAMQQYISSKSKKDNIFKKHKFKITIWLDDPDSQVQYKTELQGVKFNNIELDGFKRLKEICEYKFPFTFTDYKYIKGGIIK